METNILVAGFGGQGVMMLGKLLSYAVCKDEAKNVTFFPSYGAEQRGGTANCYVVVSDGEVGAPVSETADDLVVMNGPSLNKFLPGLKPGGNLFINSSIVKEKINRDDINIIEVPVTEMSLEMGNPKVLNVIMLGAIIGHTGVLSKQVVEETIIEQLGKKPKLIPLNKEAYEKGFAIGAASKSS